jgi:hypothetical protein
VSVAVQLLADTAGLVLLGLAVLLMAGNAVHGQHHGPLKVYARPHTARHIPGLPPVQGPQPQYVYAYLERRAKVKVP